MTERLEIKAALSVTDTGEITGIAWPFHSPDRVGDVIEKGAFTPPETLPMLFAHDQGQPIGVWDDIRETDQGLTVKGRLLVETVQRAAEVRSLIKERAVTGLSIGFVTKAAKPRARGRTITALDLHEISVVAVPCHPAAQITSIKAAGDAASLKGNPVNTELEHEPVVNDPVIEQKAFDEMKARLDKMEAKLNRPIAANNNNNPLGDNDNAVEKKAFASFLRFGAQTPADELKALNISTDTQGGYFAPAEVSSEFLRDLILVSPIRVLASVRQTSAPSVVYPKRTGITNATWRGEVQTRTASEPAFGQAEVIVRELNTFVDISNQLLADSAGLAEQEVRLALADDFGQKEGTAFVNGDGVLAPEGFMINADIAYTPSGNASLVTADSLIALAYALPTAYRNAATWGMNSKTLGIVRTLKDGQGNYLWQPSYQAGQPETILGRPVVELPDMPDVAANAFPIILGDFAGYRIVDRVAMSILSDPYSLAINGMTRIHASRRLGGSVVQAARFRKLKVATS